MSAEQHWTIEQHRTPGGRVPVVEFLNGLRDERGQNEAAALILRLRESGNLVRPPRSKALGGGLYELRGHQVRIFYVFRANRRAVLLDGMVKKQDKIPAHVLTRVRQYQRENDEQERLKAL